MENRSCWFIATLCVIALLFAGEKIKGRLDKLFEGSLQTHVYTGYDMQEEMERYARDKQVERILANNEDGEAIIPNG